MKKLILALGLIIAFSACEKENVHPNNKGREPIVEDTTKRYFPYWLINLKQNGGSNYYKITNAESLRIESIYTQGDTVEVHIDIYGSEIGVWGMVMQPYISDGNREGIYFRPPIE